MSLLEPFGNTETFGWPMSCHMPYWVEDGQTLLSSSAVFGFLGISSIHNYKCYSFHLEYHGLKNAFGGGSENDGSLISLEAFLHFLFGGLFPFCHCEKGMPSSKIPEVRKFFMEKLTKGQSIEMSSPAETRELPTNPDISRDHGEPKGQYEIKISKYYSIEARDSFCQGGALSEQCTDIQRSDSGTGAVTSDGHNIRVITDTDLNDASDERMDDDCCPSEGRRVAFLHHDSQIRQVSGQSSNSTCSSFVCDAAVQPETQIEDNSLLDCASVRLHEQHMDVGFGSVVRNVKPTEYTPRKVIKRKNHKPCAVGEDSMSQAVTRSVGDPTGFGGDDDDDDDDNGDQNDKFAAIVVKQENVEGELQGRQCTSSCVLVTDSNLESSEGLELGHSDEDSAVDCGPIEIVHLPQEIATGASYFDPSTSSITTSSVDNHMTSVQQSEGIGSRSIGLPTKSSHSLKHSTPIDQTPDGIARHLQYSQPVERENFNRNTATDSDQNHVFNLGLHTDAASQWNMPRFAAPLRHKLGQSGAASTCTSTNYSQLHQEPSPGSATVILHNKRMRTDVENATITTNIPRHTSVPPTTELNQVPSWISLGSTTARALNVMSGAQRQESNTGNPSSMNSSMSSITRSPVRYAQGTSLLNSNIGQGSLSSATGMPSTKQDQPAEERTDSSTSRKSAGHQCIKCKAWVEYGCYSEHNCGQLKKCPDCGRTFAYSRGLKRHMLIHTGEKPFTCDFMDCSKAFPRKDTLDRHIRLCHT